MNRLWVRVCLMIAGVALIITLFPLAYRLLTPPRSPTDRAALEGLPAEIVREVSPERVARIQENFGNRLWSITWGTVLIGAAFGIGVGVWLSRSLAKPLNELEKGAREVAAQNLTYRVPEVGTDEMRTVAATFNEMAEELERAQTLRHNLLADVTHELRHPVHILRGNLRGILDGVFPLAMEEIALLAEETEHLSRLVNDLHELALAEARELPLHPQLTELNTLVKDAVDAVKPLAIDGGVALQTDTPDRPVEYVLDSARMRQAVQNLLSNAIRFTGEGGRVSVALLDSAEAVTLRVSDNGTGIAPEDLPFVFDRFYRSDTSRSRDSGGAGLGLAIVKAIVEAHNGLVAVESPGDGGGSSFVITLPRNA